jgi:hypothetical protein
MRKLTLAIILPVLQCGLLMVLWYWVPHATSKVVVYEDISVSSAAPISMGVNAPAALFSWLVYMVLGWLLNLGSGSRTIPLQVFQSVFLLCALGTWYWIGHWLDHRAIREVQIRPVRFTILGLLFHLLLLAMGVFFLLFSFHLGTSFSEAIAEASLQTWAVFLIGAPVLALARRLHRLRREKGAIKSVELDPRTSRPQLANFHWLLIGTGLFGAFLLFAFLLVARSKSRVRQPLGGGSAIGLNLRVPAPSRFSRGGELFKNFGFCSAWSVTGLHFDGINCPGVLDVCDSQISNAVDV